MRHLTLIILGIMLSFNMNAQTSDSLIISKLIKVVIDIDTNPDYQRLHEDGELTKKKLLLFEKHIGGFYSNIVYSDTSILSVENNFYYKKNSRTKNEKSYFSDNKLIGYNEEINDNNSLQHRVEAYFNNGQLIKLQKEINDNFVFDKEKEKAIIEKSKKEISLRQMTTSEWKRIFGKN